MSVNSKTAEQQLELVSAMGQPIAQIILTLQVLYYTDLTDAEQKAVEEATRSITAMAEQITVAKNLFEAKQ